jgi:hypothetical protein
MKHSRRITALMAVMLATVGLGTVAPAQAELRVVDGNLWAASSLDEKRAYLIGVANAVAVNRALQVKRGTLDRNAPNNRIEVALDAGTIDRAIDRIDGWYSANPQRKDAPVLGVIWLEMVQGR